MKKIIAVLVVLATVLSLSSCEMSRLFFGIFSSEMTEFFDAWEPVEDPNVAFVDYHSSTSITVGGEKINIQSILDSGPGDTVDYYAAVVDGVLYAVDTNFCGEGEYDYALEIWSIDFALGNSERIYEGYFTPKNAPDGTEVSLPKCYYSDYCIVISDGAKQVVFDIPTKTAAELPASDYSEPKGRFEIERYRYGIHNWIDFSKFNIKCGSEERLITVDYMAERHEYIRSVVDLGPYERIVWREGGPTYPMESFFYKANVIGDRIYIVGEILEYDGESNAVIFAYDYDEDKFTFLAHHFCSGTPDHVVIPVVTTN